MIRVYIITEEERGWISRHSLLRNMVDTLKSKESKYVLKGR